MNNSIPTFIDFEASSLDLVSSFPIEVGVCNPEGVSQSWLIKPHIIWQDWSAKAARVHGISQAQLQQEGAEISVVVEQLNNILSGKVYCDAWTFDSFWLHRLYKTAKTKPNFELDSVISILNQKQIEHWQSVHDQVIKDLKLVRHRAANDAKILHETWRRITEL